MVAHYEPTDAVTQAFAGDPRVRRESGLFFGALTLTNYASSTMFCRGAVDCGPAVSCASAQRSLQGSGQILDAAPQNQALRYEPGDQRGGMKLVH